MINLLHKGRYYQIYNSYDSYFHGLGHWLVQEILKDGSMSTWHKLLELTRYVPEDGHRSPHLELMDEKLFKELVDTLPKTEHDVLSKWFRDDLTLCHQDLPNKTPDSHLQIGDWMIQYVYVIDFDRSKFLARDMEKSYQIYELAIDEKLSQFLDAVPDKEGLYRPDLVTIRTEFPIPGKLYSELEDVVHDGFGLNEASLLSQGWPAQIFKAQGDSGEEVVKVFRLDVGMTDLGHCLLPVNMNKTDKDSGFVRTLTFKDQQQQALDNALKVAKRDTCMAELLCKNPHPNLVAVKQVSKLAYSMVKYDYDLNNRQLESSKMSSEEAMTVAKHISAALVHLQRLGVVHHDVKPGNIFYKDGNYVLGDFESVCVPFYDPKKANDKFADPWCTYRTYTLEMPAEPSRFLGVPTPRNLWIIKAVGCATGSLWRGATPFNRRTLGSFTFGRSTALPWPRL